MRDVALVGIGKGTRLARTVEVWWTTGASAAAVMEAAIDVYKRCEQGPLWDVQRKVKSIRKNRGRGKGDTGMGESKASEHRKICKKEECFFFLKKREPDGASHSTRMARR